MKMDELINKLILWYKYKYKDEDIELILNTSFHSIANEDNVKYLLEEFNKIKNMDIRSQRARKMYLISQYVVNNIYDYNNLLDYLDEDESEYIKMPEYENIIWYKNGNGAHVHLTKDGYILETEWLDEIKPLLRRVNFEGVHLNDFVMILQEKNYIDNKNGFVAEKDRYINEILNRVDFLFKMNERMTLNDDSLYGKIRTILFNEDFQLIKDINSLTDNSKCKTI